MRDLSVLALPGLLAARHPAAAAYGLLAVVLLTVGFMPWLTFDTDVHRAFASGHGGASYARSLDAGGEDATAEILVLVRSDTPFVAADYVAIRDMALVMALADNVTSVASLASARFPRNHPDFPEHPLLPFDVTGIDITARIAAYEEALPGARPFVSADRRTALIAVVTSAAGGSAALETTLAEIRAVTAASERSNLHFLFTGEELIGPAIVDALARDLLVFNLAGGVLAFLLALAIFGNLRLVALACAPAFLAALSSLGVFLVLGYPVTVLNNVVPILTLVLALADSVHLVLHLRDETGDGPVALRIEKTLRLVGPACAMTAITTSIAFLTIAVTDNPTLRELAVTGALAVFAAYVVVIVAFAVLAPHLARGAAPRRHGRWLSIPAPAARAILDQRRIIAAGGLALFILAAGGASRLHPWFDLDNNLPTDSDVRAANALVTEAFGGFFHLWAETEYAGDDAWQRLSRLTDAMQAAAPGTTIVSLASFARWLGTPDAPPSAADMALIPDALRGLLLSPDGATARVLALVPQPMASGETLAAHDRLERAAREAGATRLVGLPMLMRHEPAIIVRDLSAGLVTACLIATGLIAFAFRSVRLIPVLLLPNLLPLAVTAAALWLFNDARLTPTALLALTVAFGIAVDDSIHFINRFSAERARGLAKDDALTIAISQTGRAMIATTALISLGISVTMLSAFDTVKLFGGMLILTFLVALAADLLLLPALLRSRWAAR